MEKGFIAVIVFVLALRSILNYLPLHKPESARWSKSRVKDCGGLLFYPFYLGVGIAFNCSIELLIVGGVIWATGLIDDLVSIAPWEKLSIQVCLAALLVLCGWKVNWFSNSILNTGVSVFWIVGFTNSLNMLDNIDGLAAGVSAIALSFICFLAPSPLAQVLIVVCLGFLVFNFPPARVFMGDCGAMFLGLNLACLSMKIGPLAMLILAVPIADTTFVTVRRLLQGKSPARGGRDHLSHELAKRFNSDFAPLVVLWGASLMCGLVAINLI